MPTYKTKQTYDVCSKSGYLYLKTTSIVDARKRAIKLCSKDLNKYSDIYIYKNPSIKPDGTVIPRELFIVVTTEMFIRPKYEFKQFGKETILLKNGRPSGSYKYYLIDKDGNISMTSKSFEEYFDHSRVKPGIWERPRR